MSKPNESITIRILDRELQITCSDEEHEHLLSAARFLDLRLRDARDRGPSLSLEKLAIMTALNISDNLLKAEQELKHRSQNVDDRIEQLTDRVSRHLDGCDAGR